MARRIGGHLRSNVVAYLALFVALGGTAYAAGHINGKTIKRNSIPGNRLKNNSVTGTQVNASSLGTVPNATNAATATKATSADTAKDAATLGGVAKEGLGVGVVSGGIDNPGNGAKIVPPYGIFEPGDFSIEAIAPVAMTLRDFVGEANSGFAGGESVAFSFEITPPNSGVNSVPLCTVSSVQLTCRVNGPVTVPQDSAYRIQSVGTGLSGNETVGFQYRAAAG